MKSIRGVLAAAAIAAALVVPAVQGQEKGPIRIGAIIAQSPPGSVVQGTQVRDGLEVARDILNDKGGILGRKVELVFEDGQGVPERGRAAAERLIAREKVVALTGEHQSSNVLAEIEVAHRYGIPYINTNGWSDAIRAKGYPEVFNPSNYNTRVAQAMAEVIRDLGAKRVVAFAENTDYGIGQAKRLGELLAESAPQVNYEYHALDRQARDFQPAILPLRANPPDLVANMMLPPAAYILMNQLHEQGVAPTARTWLFDGAGLADYPDFWDNVGDAARTMLEFGLYHPAMDQPPLGLQVGKMYTERTGNAPNRLIFQAADSLFLLAAAMEQAGTTDGAAVIKTLQQIEWTGTRGTVTFSSKPGYTFQQWVEVPYVTYQLTETGQAIADAPLVQGPGMELDPKKLMRP